MPPTSIPRYRLRVARDKRARYPLKVPFGCEHDGDTGKAAESDGNVGKIVGYNYLAEPLAKTVGGAPMVLRAPDGKLNLANFMQMQIYSTNMEWYKANLAVERLASDRQIIQ